VAHDFRGHKADTPYVQVTVLFAESQSFGQMSANHVTIEHCHPAALLKDYARQSRSGGGFSRSA